MMFWTPKHSGAVLRINEWLTDQSSFDSVIKPFLRSVDRECLAEVSRCFVVRNVKSDAIPSLAFVQFSGPDVAQRVVETFQKEIGQ